MESISAVCFKCRGEPQPIQKPELVPTKNNRTRATGICPKCGGKVSRFVTVKKSDQSEK